MDLLFALTHFIATIIAIAGAMATDYGLIFVPIALFILFVTFILLPHN